jgi:hypothetical protein
MSGIVGVLGVLAGSWFTAQRDDRRWKRELEHEQDRWQREDERRWAEERRALYAQYLAAVLPWMVRARYWKSPYFDPDTTIEVLRKQEKPFDWQATCDSTDELEHDIELIGSDRAVSAARSLTAQLLGFEACHIKPYTMKQLDVMAAECEARFDRLKSVLRDDLGIVRSELVDEQGQ